MQKASSFTRVGFDVESNCTRSMLNVTVCNALCPRRREIQSPAGSQQKLGNAKQEPNLNLCHELLFCLLGSQSTNMMLQMQSAPFHSGDNMNK
jgi:hypothetical protein